MRDKKLPFERYIAKLDKMGLPTLSSAGFYFKNGGAYVLYPCWGMSPDYKPQMLYIASGGISRGNTTLEEFAKFITLTEIAGLWLKRENEELFRKAQEEVYKDYETYEIYKGKELNLLGYVLINYFLTTQRKEFRDAWEELKRNNFVLSSGDNTASEYATLLVSTIFKWEGSDWLLFLEFYVWQTYYSLRYKQRGYQVSPIASASINSGAFWHIPEVRAYMQEIAKPEYMKRFFDHLDSLIDITELLEEVAIVGGYEIIKDVS